MKKHLDSIRRELKILRHQANQYQSGILTACSINIKREIESIEELAKKEVERSSQTIDIKEQLN